MSEKRKYEPSTPTPSLEALFASYKVPKTENDKPKKQYIVEKVISSAPTYKRDEEKEPQVAKPAYYEEIPAYLLERASNQMGTTYQQALKAADGGRSQPQYVFPHLAPNKGQTSSQQTQYYKRYFRSAGGEAWEDPTMAEWDQSDYRIFVGNLGNEVNDDTLSKAFYKYPSYQRAKVVRDKKSGKTKGFGFVSFSDPTDFTRALREMNGKYIGNRPCKITRSRWKDRSEGEKEQPVKFK